MSRRGRKATAEAFADPRAVRHRGRYLADEGDFEGPGLRKAARCIVTDLDERLSDVDDMLTKPALDVEGQEGKGV
jgi:hypothetical protein